MKQVGLQARALGVGERVQASGLLDLRGVSPTLAVRSFAPDAPEINGNLPACDLADANGVLDMFRQSDGIHVEGIWTGTTILVQRVSAAQKPAGISSPGMTIIRPYEPEEGWTESKPELLVEFDHARERLSLTGTTLWFLTIPVRTRQGAPTACSYILTSDPKRAEAELRRHAPHSLVIRHSAYTRPQLQRVWDSLKDENWRFFGIGEGLDERGEIRLRVDVPILSSSNIDWAERAPRHYVRLQPWIRSLPVNRSRRSSPLAPSGEITPLNTPEKGVI
ncbi:hypothetical protein [Psychromicrobium xiongbiense]|uniref:hypothetical protein n=1 Tax=Psychromicrobium xiongbiense TaxID=3051184 RepID=UPI002557461A|nr:hypothetical protein [Psychromicrobium sp. YIM S02556]